MDEDRESKTDTAALAGFPCGHIFMQIMMYRIWKAAWKMANSNEIFSGKTFSAGGQEFDLRL